MFKMVDATSQTIVAHQVSITDQNSNTIHSLLFYVSISYKVITSLRLNSSQGMFRAEIVAIAMGDVVIANLSSF